MNLDSDEMVHFWTTELLRRMEKCFHQSFKPGPFFFVFHEKILAIFEIFSSIRKNASNQIRVVLLT